MPTPPPPREDLRDLIERRRLELGDGEPLPLREVARRSGYGVSYETLRKLVMGRHAGAITNRVAQGIALGLDLPVSAVFAASSVPPAGEPWVLPERLLRLTPRQRAKVEEFAAMLLEAYDQGRNDRG